MLHFTALSTSEWNDVLLKHFALFLNVSVSLLLCMISTLSHPNCAILTARLHAILQ